MFLKNNKNSLFLFTLIVFFVLFFPGFSFAQIQFSGAPNSQVFNISNILILILNVIWVVAVTFVIIFLVLAGFKYLTAQGETGKVKEANQAIVWAVVGIIVIILAFSMISIIQRTISN